MEIVAMLALAAVGGIFTLAFKQRSAFKRLRLAFTAISPSALFGAGFLLGRSSVPDKWDVPTIIIAGVLCVGSAVFAVIGIAAWLSGPDDEAGGENGSGADTGK